MASRLVLVLRHLREEVLLLIDVAEHKVEDDGEDKAYNGRAAKVPSQIRVLDHGRAGQSDGIGDCRVEEVDGGDEAAHIFGGAGVGDAVGGDVDEELRDATNGVGNGDPLVFSVSIKGNKSSGWWLVQNVPRW